MTKNLYLIGGGGHGKVLIDTLLQLGLPLSGILDSRLKIGEQVLGAKVLGDDDYLNNTSTNDVLLVNGIGANPKLSPRCRIFESFKSAGFSFPSVIHGSVVKGSNIDFGEGCQILAGSILQQGIIIGRNVVVNTGARVDHDCKIGDHSFIAPGVTICGDVKLEDSVFIGAGSILLPGVRIGRGAIVGAGTVVTRSVPESWIVVGNPARKMGENEC